MRALNNFLGSYMPSFFRMNLSFPFPSGYLPYLQLNDKDLTIFLHEYIHFLQDISTFTGLNNAYVYSESLHYYVNKIYDLPYGKIRVPLSINWGKDNVALNRYINTETLGSIDEITKFFITSITKKIIDIPYSSTEIKNLTQIELHGANKTSVIFGSRAIMESMAYLMEFYISKGSKTPPDFPYTSAEMVVNQIYPEFGQDKLRIIALCDASLLFAESGRIFYDTLQYYKSINQIPDNPNDIIDLFYSDAIHNITQEENLSYKLFNMGITVGERLKLYMNHIDFHEFHNVIHTLIGFGVNVRWNNRYFMLDIARGGYICNNWYLRNTIAKTGTPIIEDSNSDYLIITPIGFSPENYWIEYFPAIEQVYKSLNEGSDCCDLWILCNQSPKVTTDDRCINSPWERSSDKYLCPFGMLWKHWNLSRYIPIT